METFGKFICKIAIKMFRGRGPRVGLILAIFSGDNYNWEEDTRDLGLLILLGIGSDPGH